MPARRALPSVVAVDVLTAMYAQAWSRLSPQVLELVVVPPQRDDDGRDAHDG